MLVIMKVLMVRHAKALNREEWSAQNPDDMLRPLSENGIQEFVVLAHQLASVVANVNCILASPAQRTVQTAGILSEVFDQAKVIEHDAFLQGAPIKRVEKTIREYYAEDRVLVIVGHENHFSQILAHLLTAEDTNCLHFKKGGSALLQVKDIDSRMQAQLRWMMTPKMMKSLSCV